MLDKEILVVDSEKDLQTMIRSIFESVRFRWFFKKETKTMYSNSILEAHGKAKKEDLDYIEQKFHVKIPAEVREHYLMYNGGYPEKPVFTDKNGEEYIIDWFIPVRRRKGRSIGKTLGLLREDDGVIPEWLIPFADEDGRTSSVSA